MSIILVSTLLFVSLTAAETRHPRPLSPINHGADSGSHLDQRSSVNHKEDGTYSGTRKNVHAPPLDLVAKLNQEMLEQIKALQMDYSNKLDIYNHRMDTMAQRLVESDVKMETMKQRLVESDVKIETMTQRLVESDVKMGTMKQRLVESDVKTETMKQRLVESDVKIETTTQRLDNVIKENNELRAYLPGLWNPVDGRRTNKHPDLEGETRINPNTTIHAHSEVQLTGVVAFQARISSFAGPAETTIPFDIVDLSIGDAYDAITGEFTPPVDGIYGISYGVLADSSCGTDHVCVLLQVNGVYKSGACSEYVTSDGTSVILQLSAGDTVVVVISTSPCVTLHSNNIYNTFSGHLIYQII